MDEIQGKKIEIEIPDWKDSLYLSLSSRLYGYEEKKEIMELIDDIFSLRPTLNSEYEIIQVETDGKNEQHAGIIKNFANALLGLEEFFVDGLEGINGVELMNAIELSGWNNGEEIPLPIDEDRYLKELNEHRATSRLKVVEESAVADTANTFAGNK